VDRRERSTVVELACEPGSWNPEFHRSRRSVLTRVFGPLFE
jgi:hypothetical protein